ncbi:MAG: hypothetical protein AB3X44_04530 [Leptothrix sp. (in: b-proteobacteria)]
MTNAPEPSTIPTHRMVVVLAILYLLVGLLMQAWRLGDGILQDPFHFGEFLAALTTLTATVPESPALLPLTIHGGIDIVPGWLVSLYTGDEHHFLPTVVAYAGLNSLASVLALAVAARLSPATQPISPATLLATALIAPLCVGFRDIFLLAALLLHLLLRDRCERDGVTAPATRALEVALGITVAFGLHASFDRGLAAAISLGIAHMPRALRLGQGPQPGRVALIAFVATIAVGPLIHPMLSPSHYIENVQFLASTSAQWRYQWDRQTTTLTIALTMLALAAWTLALQGWRCEHPTPAQKADLIALSLLALFLLRIGTNRADIQHILMGLWGPLILAAWWHGQPGWRAMTDPLTRLARLLLITGTMALALYYKIYPVLAATMALGVAARTSPAHPLTPWHRRMLIGLLVLPVLILASHTVRHARDGQFRWVARLTQLPSNDSLSPPGVRWAAAKLREAAVDCVFDLSNNGLIQALVRKPTCSRITYPVYGGPAHEAELIDTLARRQPSALVSSSNHWAYAIDNRSMAVRFPTLDRYIHDHYPIEHCGEGYCVRLLQL